MEIGVLIPRVSQVGGADKVAINQVRYFIKNGYKSKLLTLSKPSLKLDVPHSIIGFKSPFPFMKTSLPVLVNIIWGLEVKKPEVDVIVAHGIASILALRIKKKYGINYVSYIHHPNSFLYGAPIHENEERDILGPLADYPFRFLWSKSNLAKKDLESIREANYTFVNSQRTLQLVLNIHKGIKAEVCYPAIEDTFHNILPKPELKEELILYASRHTRQKGFHLLPEILSRIKSKAKLIIAGRTTNLTRTVIEKVNKLGLSSRIIFKPNVSEEELLDFYKKSKVLLFPAFKEDFGLSPVEGMASGCIPVAWKDGGGIEETIQDLKTGLLAKPYDVDDYASKVDLLLTDYSLYSSILNEAKNFSRKFSWSAHVKEILKHLPVA